MFILATIDTTDGLSLPVFLFDTDTGYSGKDVLKIPGAYEAVTTTTCPLCIVQLQGKIGTYATKGMFLVPELNQTQQHVDISNKVQKYISMPETAMKVMLNSEVEEERGVLERSLDAVSFYSNMTVEEKVFLPEDSFKYMEEGTAEKMRSTRQVYVLKGVDNQEIVQASNTSEYGVTLPSVDVIHSTTDCVSALDILRVLAPCRREVSTGIFQYNAIYHTPYFMVDPRLRGALPSYLEWLNGYVKNDTLEIQPFERHMYDNLYTLYCSDTAVYVRDIVVGLFLSTNYGQKLRKLIWSRDEETVLQVAGTLLLDVPDGVSCEIPYSDLTELTKDAWSAEDTAALVKQYLNVAPSYIENLIQNTSNISKVVDIERLLLSIEISDAEAENYTSLLIENNIISKPFMSFVISLCQKAYEVNWGHTGAAMAIPHFVTTGSIDNMGNVMAAYLGEKLGKVPFDRSKLNQGVLYDNQVIQDISDDDDLESDSEEEIFASFNFYITAETARKISTDSLSADYFEVNPNFVGSRDTEIVEYWHKVNGENNLYYFLSTAFIATGNVKLLLEAFVKLMRWGDIKPATLTFADYPEVTTLFDLKLGTIEKNYAVVDESQLRLVNGCKYSLDGILLAEDVVSAGQKSIIGFKLIKDYGEVKKIYLASLVDIGEMTLRGEIDVAEFKSVQEFDLERIARPITDFATERYDFYTSDRNIELGLKYNIKPNQLSELALLVAQGVLRSAEYLKSKNNAMIVTSKDRQYQILSMYVAAIRSLNKEFPELASIQKLSTLDMTKYSEYVYNIFVNGEKKQAPSVNEVRAAQAISSLNLNIGGNPNISFTDVPLNGKFSIIYDENIDSIFPAMNFSDTRVQSVANRVKNRVVLLLFETDTLLVFCRKDITASEVLVVNGKISCKKYSTVKPIVDAIMNGSIPSVTVNSDGSKKKAVFHESLKEFI